DFAQIQMNYLDWEFSTTEEEYNILTERNIPVIVMESVRGGRLSSLTPELDARLQEKQPGWSVSSWAFRWLMTHDNVLLMLSGMSTLEQVEDNLRTFEKDSALTPELSKFLIEIAHQFKKGFTVPCTACRYCTPHCPMQLDIPGLLKIYNDYKYERRWSKNALSAFEADKLPSNCIGCGSCAEYCPQSIDIPSFMKRLASLNETGKEL
ncbi:MAG: 4Fe-4S dicluster domain-containing protein, partial [Spirochaetales bacterium]|nr:4Fe-4S dicluster domain-containing protein [Spirochaetales bacterium]